MTEYTSLPPEEEILDEIERSLKLIVKIISHTEMSHQSASEQRPVWGEKVIYSYYEPLSWDTETGAEVRETMDLRESDL
jgi:hypothetical protein